MNFIPVLLSNDAEIKAPSLTDFDLWVETVIEHRGDFFQVSIEIVDITSSQDLNKTYRKKDKPTNVLSFPLELPEYVKEDLIGDLAICAEIVEQEAAQYQKSSKDHWAHLTIHGTLHLLGYDHINDEDAKIMEALEIELLKKLNIANPYQ